MFFGRKDAELTQIKVKIKEIDVAIADLGHAINRLEDNLQSLRNRFNRRGNSALQDSESDEIRQLKDFMAGIPGFAGVMERNKSMGGL